MSGRRRIRGPTSDEYKFLEHGSMIHKGRPHWCAACQKITPHNIQFRMAVDLPKWGKDRIQVVYMHTCTANIGVTKEGIILRCGFSRLDYTAARHYNALIKEDV